MCLLMLTSCVSHSEVGEGFMPEDVQQLPVTAPEYTGEKDENVFYIEGEWPDIGEFGMQNERFYEDITTEFIPSEEYGTIIPYIGAYKEFSTDFDTMYYASYGFCTPEGKIVMDASKNVPHIWLNRCPDGFEYYQVSFNESDFDVAPARTLIVPRDGSWSLEIKRGWVGSVGDGVICINVVKDNENYQTYTELYDYNGKKLGKIDGYDSLGTYSHGMFNAEKWGSDSSSPSACYIDLNGNVVLGPYKYAQSFSKEGVAIVTDLDGECYMIDTKGNRITHGNYESIHRLSYDENKPYYYSANIKEKYATRDILDANGNFIVQQKGGAHLNFCLQKNGDIIYYYRNNDGTFTWKHLIDGTPVVSKDYGVSPNQYDNGVDVYVYKDEEKKTAVFMDGEGNTVAYIEDDFERLNGVSSDGRYISYVSRRWESVYDPKTNTNKQVNNSRQKMYDTETDKVIIDLEGDGYISFAGDRYVIVSTYRYDGSMSGQSLQFLYDLEKGEYIVKNARLISTFSNDGKSWFNVCTDNYCALYDHEMNVVFKTYFD